MRLASRGRRDIDGGEQPILDAEEQSRVRQQAARVQWRAIAFGIVLTAILMLIPPFPPEA